MKKKSTLILPIFSENISTEIIPKALLIFPFSLLLSSEFICIRMYST